MTLSQPRILEVRILVPVWGQEYIDDFLNYSMQALLLDRNIPLVARNYKITINFLTTDQGISDIKAHEQYIKIKKYARIVFISVEDLVVDFNYSTILTLAYARGLQAIRANSYFRTCFILLNSDFILSNGSLHSLVQAGENGASAVYGASLRINSENTKAKLLNEFEKKTKQKFFSSRSLVRFALKNLHPTVKAMTINQNTLSYQIYTKIYWHLSNKLLISHDYLLCCMALVPTKRLEQVSSYVDYSFAAELSDPDTRVVIADSDDYLAIEIQGKDTEIEFIEIGSKSLKYIAKHISSWTTKEHREVSNSLIKFHSTNLPSSFDKQVEKFEKNYSEISRKLTRKPMSHIDHPHWVGGLNAWLFHVRLKFGGDIKLSDISPQVKPVSQSIFASRIRPRISLAWRKLVGLEGGKWVKANLSPSLASPEHIDFELISKTVASTPKSNKALIVNLTDAFIPNKIEGSEVLTYGDYYKICRSRFADPQRYFHVEKILVVYEVNEYDDFLECIRVIRDRINREAPITFHISYPVRGYGSSDEIKSLMKFLEIGEIQGIRVRTYRRRFLRTLLQSRNSHIMKIQRLAFKRIFPIMFSLLSLLWISFFIVIVNLLIPIKENQTICGSFDSFQAEFND